MDLRTSAGINERLKEVRSRVQKLIQKDPQELVEIPYDGFLDYSELGEGIGKIFDNFDHFLDDIETCMAFPQLLSKLREEGLQDD